MDFVLNNLHIPLEKDGEEEYLKAASEKLHLDASSITLGHILSKSLDIRDQEQFYYILSIIVTTPPDYNNHSKIPVYKPYRASERVRPGNKTRPLIVGFGPAGMFAALECIEHGLQPIIFERGKKIGQRSQDVQHFIRERELDPESNVQFGEGGAGSFSDGKLFSRRNNNTSYINRVLRTFVKFGAPKEIEYISKPHLGTDVLCKIVRNIRQHILERGGEIHYSAKMTDILVSQGAACGILVNSTTEYLSSAIFIALGHSARETYAMLSKRGLDLEQKNISVGVRIEHPVETINLMRYGAKYKDCPTIGAATYSLNYTNRSIRRGVYTFCMCPGGEIVNASSGPGMMVVNGMSYSKRSSPFSNAAMAVSCHTSDYLSSSSLAGLEFQKKIEKKAYEAGGSDWHAPAQNLMNFLGKSNCTDLHENSFKMGVVVADMRDILPGFVTKELVAAFTKWQEEVPLFISHEALLIGAETRTSSPVRMRRNENYESTTLKNVYPIGEGSGYTGGITSSAADAVKAVEKYVSGVS